MEINTNIAAVIASPDETGALAELAEAKGEALTATEAHEALEELHAGDPRGLGREAALEALARQGGLAGPAPAEGGREPRLAAAQARARRAPLPLPPYRSRAQPP